MKKENTFAHIVVGMTMNFVNMMSIGTTRWRINRAELLLVADIL